MRRIIFLSILLVSMILIASCDKKEIINISLTDQIVTIVELLDKNLEIDYNKAAKKPIIFINKDEYIQFAKQYFINSDIGDFEFQNYDLLFINIKKINPAGDTLYNTDSITKHGDKVEIILKQDGKVTSMKSNKDSVIENALYIRLSKGTISPKSDFDVIKKEQSVDKVYQV